MVRSAAHPSLGAQASPPAASPARASGRATTSWARPACAARPLPAPPVKLTRRHLPAAPCRRCAPSIPRPVEKSRLCLRKEMMCFAAIMRAPRPGSLKSAGLRPRRAQHRRRAQEELRARQAALGPRDVLTVQARPRRFGASNESAPPVTLRFRCARARGLRSECAHARHGGAACAGAGRWLPASCAVFEDVHTRRRLQLRTSACAQEVGVPACWLYPARRSHTHPYPYPFLSVRGLQAGDGGLAGPLHPARQPAPRLGAGARRSARTHLPLLCRRRAPSQGAAAPGVLHTRCAPCSPGPSLRGGAQGL